MMPDSDPIEIAARVIADLNDEYFCPDRPCKEMTPNHCVCADKALDIIAALEADGIRLVRREATEEMVVKTVVLYTNKLRELLTARDAFLASRGMSRGDVSTDLESEAMRAALTAMWDASPVFGTPPSEQQKTPHDGGA